MSETWHPLGFLAQSVVLDLAKRRAKPTFKQPDYLAVFDHTGDVEALAQYELEAERKQRETRR